jgi:hypothetical protein
MSTAATTTTTQSIKARRRDLGARDVDVIEGMG